MNKAILLVGASGSGKTPLGSLLEREGLQGRRCMHFDFGEWLRRVASGPPGLLTPRQTETVSASVNGGTLLTDGNFPIAEKLLRHFLAERAAEEHDLVVLNGLPRHVGQAKDIERIVTVVGVVRLSCTADIAWERIRLNLGGDRASRTDDTIEQVRRRLTRFEEHSLPLLEFYRARNVPVHTIETDLCTTAQTVLAGLAELAW
jgi:adenylate kinase